MGKTAFMFPGQGTQSVGMLQDICDAYPVAKDTFAEADAVLGQSISDLVVNGPTEILNQTVHTQPAVLTAEIATFRVIRSENIEPDILAGFSLGEWAAIIAADVLPFNVALKLVRLRAQAMQEAVPIGKGGMAVIMGKSEQEAVKICTGLKHYLVPANYNYPGQITVSGSAAAIQELCGLAEEQGVVVSPLAISIPSHCELMEPAAQCMKEALESVEFRDARWPIILTSNNVITTNAEVIRQNMIDQLTMAVRFQQSVRKMMDQGVDVFLELGPGKTLAGFVRKNAKEAGIKVYSSRTDSLSDLQAAILMCKRR